MSTNEISRLARSSTLNIFNSVSVLSPYPDLHSTTVVPVMFNERERSIYYHAGQNWVQMGVEADLAKSLLYTHTHIRVYNIR